MMLAYLVTVKGKTIGLVAEDGKDLRWESETPGLAEEAERFVPTNEIPESGGNPAAWAIRRLAEFIPGDTQVLGTNIAPGDKKYNEHLGG